MLGPALATSKSAPLADAAGVALGGWARQLLLVGAVISMLGHAGAMILATPRMLFAFARDGFLPPALARLHPVHRSPATAIVLQCAIVLALAITSTFERLAILANLSTLILYATCCLATWELRRRDVRAGGTPFRVPAPTLVIVLACLVIGWMLTGVDPDGMDGVGGRPRRGVDDLCAAAQDRRGRRAPRWMSRRPPAEGVRPCSDPALAPVTCPRARRRTRSAAACRPPSLPGS